MEYPSPLPQSPVLSLWNRMHTVTSEQECQKEDKRNFVALAMVVNALS